MRAFQDVPEKKRGAWCRRHFLSFKALRLAVRVQMQLQVSMHPPHALPCGRMPLSRAAALRHRCQGGASAHHPMPLQPTVPLLTYLHHGCNQAQSWIGGLFACTVSLASSARAVAPSRQNPPYLVPCQKQPQCCSADGAPVFATKSRHVLAWSPGSLAPARMLLSVHRSRRRLCCPHDAEL
jgi:hypothetical protein